MMKAVPVLALIVCLVGICGCSKRLGKNLKPGSQVPLASKDAVRAISLNSLQKKLKGCQAKGTCGDEVTQLAGIRTLSGVVIDNGTKDVILFGRVDPELPVLSLDDFVVALGQAWLKYAVVKGNVREYTYPGCSIDPRAEYLRNLQTIEQQMGAQTSPEGKEKTIEAWGRECVKPQSVRVMGIPFDTHFAQVMVKADYDLKRLVDGSDHVDVPGLVSISDRNMDEAKIAMSQKKKVQLPGAKLNRFWLYPGNNIYQEDGEAFFIKQCPVTLLTELMHTSSGGEVSGSGGSEPDAARFANDFTLLYRKVAQQRPVYEELEGLFRFVAIAGIIKEQTGTGESFDLSYLLDSYRVAEVPVDRSLPGRYALKKFQTDEADEAATRHAYLWLPSCGGVDIAINEQRRRVDSDKTGILGKLKAAVLKARPSADSLYWDYPDAANLLSDLELNAFVGDINQANDRNLVIGVVYKPDGYVVYDGQSEALYAGADMDELVKRIKAKSSAEPNRIAQPFLKGFPNENKARAFLSTLQLENEPYELITNPLADSTGDFLAEGGVAFTPGVRLNRESSRIELIDNGQYKGKYKLILNFIAQAGKGVKEVTVQVITERQEVADAFLSGIIRRFGGPDLSSSMTLADIVNDTHRELGSRLAAQQIISIHVDQNGGSPAAKRTEGNSVEREAPGVPLDTTPRIRLEDLPTNRLEPANRV
jgi:hypothetical protein